MNNNFLETNNFKFLINHVFNDIKQKTNYDISNNPKYIRIFKKLVQTIHTQNVNKRVSKEYLNNLVIDKCVPFIIMQLNKEQNKSLNPVIQNKQVNISNRPLSSKQRNPAKQNNLDFSNLQLDDGQQAMIRQQSVVDNISGISSRNGEKIDFTARLNDFQAERDYDDPMKQQMPLRSVNEIMGKDSKEDIDSIDIMKRMREMENERNYNNSVNDSDNFNANNNLRNIDNKSALENVNNQSLEIDNKFLQQLYENNSNAPQQNTPAPAPAPAPPPQQTSEKNNIQLNIVDKSENNRLPEYNSNIQDLKANFDQSKITTDIKEINEDLNQNSGYRYNKVPAQILVIDSINSFNNNDNVDFKVNLVENFVIDKPCDVFIEFINIQGLKSGADANPGHLETLNCLALQIDEFPIKVASNNNNLRDKFIIPNESFGTTDNAADGTIADTDDDSAGANAGNKVNATSYNIRLKSNYFCTIQPQTLNELNVKLYGLTGAGATDSFDLLKGTGATSRLIIGLFLKKHK